MIDGLFRLVVDLLDPEFAVEAEIGRGGVAVVYRAVDRSSNRPVAIKVLPPWHAFNSSTRERFLREARIGKVLVHPGIVPIYATGVREDIAYYVMRLVEGDSLAERLAWEPYLDIDESRALLAHIAEALEFAHSAGVTHRDVKPGNVMIDATTGRPLVTDFGLARTLLGDTSLTRTGDTVGTPAYMSPEQCAGIDEADARSDVYSLGAVGYCMLAGQTPFSARTIPAMLAKHMKETPPRVRSLRRGVPDSLAHVIETALAKAPGDRWPSAAAFREALGDVSAISLVPAGRSANRSIRTPSNLHAPQKGSSRSPGLEVRASHPRWMAIPGAAVLVTLATRLFPGRNVPPLPDISPAEPVVAQWPSSPEPSYVIAAREGALDFEEVQTLLGKLNRSSGR